MDRQELTGTHKLGITDHHLPSEQLGTFRHHGHPTAPSFLSTDQHDHGEGSEEEALLLQRHRTGHWRQRSTRAPHSGAPGRPDDRTLRG